MTLICELKQRVVHTVEVPHGSALQGGYFRNSREYPDFSASLVDSWGKVFCDPRVSSVLAIVYSDRNCLARQTEQLHPIESCQVRFLTFPNSTYA